MENQFVEYANRLAGFSETMLRLTILSAKSFNILEKSLYLWKIQKFSCWLLIFNLLGEIFLGLRTWRKSFGWLRRAFI